MLVDLSYGFVPKVFLNFKITVFVFYERFVESPQSIYR